MNTAVSPAPTPSDRVRQRPAAAVPAPLWRMAWHLAKHELRRQRVQVAMLWLVLVAALLARTQGVSAHTSVHYITSLAVIVLPVVIACGCVWPSSASRPELAVHTLPVGRMTLLLGHGIFLFMAVVVPWVLLDVCTAWGFGFSAEKWWLLVLGSLLTVLFPIGLSAAWMSAARTRRQQGVIFLISIITWWLLLALFEHLNREAALDNPTFNQVYGTSVGVSAVHFQVHFFGLALLGVALWILQTLTRRRRLMFWSAVVGILGLFQLTRMWPWNWMDRELPGYDGAQLRVVKGEPKLPAAVGTDCLWPELGVAGLRPGEIAAVRQFRPKMLLSTGFADLEPLNPTYYPRGAERIGVHADALRVIASTLPQGWLLTDRGELPPRDSLTRVWEMIDENPNSQWPQHRKNHEVPWQLQLAVAEVHLVAELPLAELLKGHEMFPESGVWLAIREKSPSTNFMELGVRIIRRRPMLSPDEPTLVPAPWSGNSPQRLYLVLLNDQQRLARVELSKPVANQYTGTFGISVSATEQNIPMTLEAPTNRMKLTGLTREEWISQTRVQVWWPRLKGFTELELPAAEVKRLAGK